MLVPQQKNEPLPVSTARSSYVDVAGVRKVYGRGENAVFALEDIDLSIYEGEFLSIVGPSGCGKSTLLKCIAGLESVSSGAITIRGTPISGPPPNLGVVFQRDTLADWRNVLENVLLVSEFRGLDRKICEARARELLTLFGLSEFMHRQPWELSGGMRQRAAICRALVDDPSLLLMDEPFGALDAMTRDQLNVELQRIWLNRQKTLLFITHSIAEAVFLSDRVVMMSQKPGRIIEVIDIDLPRPRRLSLRESPEFTRYVGRIRSLFTSLGILKET
jgi:NitT/TauT family transport system ATP-binding protein